MRFNVAGFVLAFALVAAPALADNSIKIAYIDPLSGGGASIGEVGLKTYQYLAEEINASGGLLGKKVEIVGLDNKTNPQESSDPGAKSGRPGHPHHHPGKRLLGGRGLDGLGKQIQ